MKKKLSSITAVLLTFFATNSEAQLADGSIASDFTFTDIAGNTQHLYSILDSGKTVFIDFSATWCGPCWSYHTSGTLENLYNSYGPNGTDELRVLFIESELTNTLAQITGTNAGNTYATATEGDWTAGTPYPIINLSTSTTGAIAALNNYQIDYFPTVYMICPNREVTEVSTALTTANLYSAMQSSCSIASASNDGEMLSSLDLNGTLGSCDSVTPIFRIANAGTSTLTSATITLAVGGVTQKTIYWTGSLNTYASTTITGVKVGKTTSGVHTITATISNPNGMADPTVSNNSTTLSFTIYASVGGAFITESFESAGIPSNWINSLSSGSYTWQTADPAVGFNSSNSAILDFYNIPSGEIDIIELPPQSFAGATAASLSFDVAYCGYTTASPENDKLEVQFSTNCGATWTSKYSKSGNTLKTKAPQASPFVPASASEWRHEVVDLNTYAGQSQVFVRLKGTSAYGNSLYVDNVNFSNFGVGIEENNLSNSIHVYPNPISNFAKIDFNLVEGDEVSIELVNNLGQILLVENLGKLNAGYQNYSLNASLLKDGFYILNIKVGANVISKKVAINKK